MTPGEFDALVDDLIFDTPSGRRVRRELKRAARSMAARQVETYARTPDWQRRPPVTWQPCEVRDAGQ